MLLFGTVPYAALQLKAVGDTFGLVIGGSGAAFGSVHWVMPLVVVMMIAFTILFGIRRLNPTERHPGMVVALAAESLTKLLAFVVAGVFITGWAFGGFSGFLSRLSAGLPTRLGFMQKASGEQLVTWMTYLLLSTAAFSFLPRQFHVGVIENSNAKHTRTAMWLTPLYMLAINVFVVPIALAAMILLPKGASADTSLLGLPLLAGQRVISLFVFVGGFSAAIGMIMVETMTMATMMSNHLFLPLIDGSPKLWFLRRHLLGARWAFAALFILAAFGFVLGIGKSYMLVTIGMLSFAAVLQLAPASLGGLFWKQGSRIGALLGLTAGFCVWNYTLLMPTFVKSGWMSDSIVKVGPWGIGALRPTALFGLEGVPSLTHGVLWTLFFNIGLYVAGSIFFPATAAEHRLAEEFVALERNVDIRDTGEASLSAEQQRANSEKLLAQYFSAAEARAIVARCVQETGIAGKDWITAVEWAELNNGVERSLAGAIGAASAHAAMHGKERADDGASKALAMAYAKMLARMRISPAELRKRVDYYQERETLLEQQAAELEQRVLERTRELTDLNEALRNEIAERKKAQAAVVGMSQQLADSAHSAGKAEIATNVLHNVGNVLNSVMVSVRLAVERMRESRVTNVARVAEMVQRNRSDLASFLTDDPRGKLLPSYLTELATHLAAERDELLVELEGVNKNAEHIKHVISVQQEFAVVSSFLQKTDLAAVIEDAIRITTLSYEGVEIVREFTEMPCMMVHKHKVLQVLVNLVSNAKHAVKGAMSRPKRVCVRLGAPREGFVSIAVIDNGVGIAQEDLERIFRHGFTTRKDGHGFGLHAAANGAREMGGSLSVSSDGPGTGATFTLEIPCDEAAVESHDLALTPRASPTTGAILPVA